MNSLAGFIEALTSEPYHLAGSYMSDDRPDFHSCPIECDFEINHDIEALTIEGYLRELATYAFRIRMEFETATLHGVPVEIASQRLRELQGRLLFFGGKGMFIGRVNAGALSAQITLERGGISVAGALALDDRYYAFTLRGGPSSTYEALANVVGIRSPKRA